MTRKHPGSRVPPCPVPEGGFSILVLVLLLCLLGSVLSLAYSDLWRGESRTLYGVHEHRQLVNLARSSLAEASHILQTALDEGRAHWVDLFLYHDRPSGNPIGPGVTRANALLMSGSRGAISYSSSDVEVQLVRPVDVHEGGTNVHGVVDLLVTVEVKRTNVRHEAKLSLTCRHAYWFSDDPGPFRYAGRRIVISPTPFASWFERG